MRTTAVRCVGTLRSGTGEVLPKMALVAKIAAAAATEVAAAASAAKERPVLVSSEGRPVQLAPSHASFAVLGSLWLTGSVANESCDARVSSSMQVATMARFVQLRAFGASRLRSLSSPSAETCCAAAAGGIVSVLLLKCTTNWEVFLSFVKGKEVASP